MRTCGNCWYFEPRAENGKDGACLVEPPKAFPVTVQVPGSAIARAGVPQMAQAIQGIETPTNAKRKACRHWSDL